MAGKTASTSVRIGSITESVIGSSSTKDVESMLQQVYLRFTKPRFDKKNYEVMVQNMENYLLRKSQEIRSKMQDSITMILYGKHNPKERIFDESYLADISLDKIESVYKKRFENASDFTFFIVGDIQNDKLKPLLEKYIASIPTESQNEDWHDVSSKWLDKRIQREVFLDMEIPKATVHIEIKNEIPYSLQNENLMRIIGDILRIRYTELLREEEGGTYGAYVETSLLKRPNEKGFIWINFDCNPLLTEKLISIVHKEIRNIAKGNIDQEDIDKTIVSYIKQREESKNYNSYDMGLLKNYVLEGYNMNNPKNFEDILKSTTKEDIQDMMNILLENPQSYEIVFKPKS